MSITVRYTWTAEEVVRAYKANQKVRFSWYHRLGLYFLFFMSITALAANLWIGAPFSGPTIFFLALVFALSFVIWGTPWWIKHQHRARPEANQAVRYHIEADKIQALVPGLSTSVLHWEAFSEVVRVPDGYLLYQGKQLFQWLPSHGFASAEELFALGEMAREHASRYREVK